MKHRDSLMYKRCIRKVFLHLRFLLYIEVKSKVEERSNVLNQSNLYFASVLGYENISFEPWVL